MSNISLNYVVYNFYSSLDFLQVTVRGPKEDVEKAKGMLESLSTEKQLTSVTAEVRAKPEHHKFLIGVKGANIKSVREETGARIIFPTEKDTDREAITILGTKEAVAQAKKELEARIKALVSLTRIKFFFPSNLLLCPLCELHVGYCCGSFKEYMVMSFAHLTWGR